MYVAAFDRNPPSTTSANPNQTKYGLPRPGVSPEQKLRRNEQHTQKRKRGGVRAKICVQPRTITRQAGQTTSVNLRQNTEVT